MKRKWPRLWTALLAAALLLIGPVSVALAAPEAAPAGAAVSSPETSVGYVEGIVAAPLPGKERVTLALSRMTAVEIEKAPGGAVLIRVPDMFVPEGLRKSLSEGALNNILRIVPEQKTVAGRQWAYVRVELREQVPYSVRQEGQMVVVDFNVAGLKLPPPAAEQKTLAQAPPPAAPPVTAVKEQSPAITKPAGGKDQAKGKDEKQYTGKRISLDFQDANIKSVLRLLSEVSGMNLVSGDDVKGNITILMNNVPWDQALDVILDIQGLTTRQKGDVVSIITLEKARKDEESRQSGEENRIKAEALQKTREQALQQDKGKLRQISIEAKIVEAEEGFIRDLGVQWGVGTKNNAGDYGYGVVAQATNSTMTGNVASGGNVRGLAAGTALTTGNLAVNFPLAAASNALGIVISGASWILDAEILAQEKTNRVKVISSPKVMTMDGVKAKVKQGEQIPIVTPATATNPASVSYKDAFLELDVKPKITDDGRVSMEIMASNNSANYSKPVLGNIPINTSIVESTVVINDGDTIVIGGVIKTTESLSEDAVPWINKIPILGWLFKYENVTRNKRELLIFVTPRIVKEAAPAAAKGSKV